MVGTISTTIVSLLKHHPSAKSRWAHITRLLINTPISPLHFSLLFLSLKTSPFLAFSLFNLSLTKNLLNHTLLSYASIIHVLARSRGFKNQTLTLIRKALIAFPNQTFQFFEMLTRSYRRFDSGPMVYDLLVEGVLRSRKVDVCVEIARVLVLRGFLTVKTRNKVVKAVCESNGSLVGYRLFREMFYFSDFCRNLKNEKNVDVRENVEKSKNIDICGDFKENLKNIDNIGVFMKNIDICADLASNENEEIFVKEPSLMRERSDANSYVYDYVSNTVQNVCSLKKNDNDMKDRFVGRRQNGADSGSVVCSIVGNVGQNVCNSMCTDLPTYQNDLRKSGKNVKCVGMCEDEVIDMIFESSGNSVDSCVSNIDSNIGQNACTIMCTTLPTYQKDVKNLLEGRRHKGVDSIGDNIHQNVCTCQNEPNENGTNDLYIRRRQSGVSSHVDKVRPNVSTYNVLLLAFYRDGMTNSLEGIWAEMTKRGIFPNAYSYNILMRAYCENEMMKEAEKVWEEMEAKGLKRDEVTYEIMIDGYCSIGKVSRAEDFFREMEMSGIKGSCGSFEHLIKGYCEIGDLGSALLLYKDMCRKGFSPEGPVVDIVVQGFCRENRVYEGLEFLRVAMKKYEIVPRWKSYEVLMKGLCDEGIMDEALKLQAEMVGKGFEPNSEIYNVFIDGYTKQGNYEMAKRMKKEMVDTQMTD